MTPRVFPIFPLEAVLLVPGALLPLHIFEPRYRAMIADTIGGDGMLAIAMPLPSPLPGADSSPPVHPVCGLGRIVRHSPYEDGRSDIVLEGIERMRIDQELPLERPYRRVLAHALPDVPPTSEDLRERLELLLAEVGELNDKQRAQLLRLAPGQTLDALLLHLPISMFRKHELHAIAEVDRRLSTLERLVGVLNNRRNPLEMRSDDPRLN